VHGRELDTRVSKSVSEAVHGRELAVLKGV
jgi:hypothetical protein